MDERDDGRDWLFVGTPAPVGQASDLDLLITCLMPHVIAESVGVREADRAEVLAHMLLNGVYRLHENKRVTFHYLSRSTKPTEKEGRLAVAELLSRLGPLGQPEPPSWLLRALAVLFAPEIAQDPKSYARTVTFKQVSQSRARPLLDWIIADHVRWLMKDGKKYNEAVAIVAEAHGRDERHIKKIYGREKSRKVASDN